MDETDSINDLTTSYRLLEVLVPDQTFLCADVSENVVVLKRLDDDCLHRNQLHPSIRDRLAKVRELAHPRIATLRTVERWEGRTCMVWIYLDGETWEEVVANPSADVATLADALRIAVEALHDLGIVHGNLHGRNIIIRPDGQLWLTDISPYLYSDPKDDINAIARLIPARVDQNSAPSTQPPASRGGRQRFTSLLAAAFLIALAVGFATIWRWILVKPVNHSPATFPSLIQPLRP